ncbi:hypothetical protein HNR25_002227 [Streptomonospora salina]|uniref:Uncharacterized protein n=1 Tax=Streptomonospora salina TaxID=104205 RepID=A0A841E645_9ACTN|nr:hypothetical protein [Streptomonospora salina]
MRASGSEARHTADHNAPRLLAAPLPFLPHIFNTVPIP